MIILSHHDYKFKQPPRKIRYRYRPPRPVRRNDKIPSTATLLESVYITFQDIRSGEYFWANDLMVATPLWMPKEFHVKLIIKTTDGKSRQIEWDSRQRTLHSRYFSPDKHQRRLE